MSAHETLLFSLRDPQAALREAPDHIEFLPVAVYACDAEGRLCWFNRRAAEFWGRRPAIGDDSELFCGSFKLYALDGTLIRRGETPMAQVLRTGEPVHGREATVERPDGSRVTAMVHIDPVKDADGRLLGAISCFHDTGDVQRARSEAAESGAMFRQVLDALPAAVYTTDAEGRIAYCNRAAVELAGREPVLGEDKWCVTWRLFTSEGEPLAHDDCPMATTLKENRPVRGVEAIAERPDGTRTSFLPFPTPLRDLSGKLVGAVNMLVDISERKEAEARQKGLLAELNHRVKNNMQMLHALLRGAQRDTQSAEAKAVLADAGQRVGAVAAAQQVLYDSPASTSFDAASFMEVVCRNARQNFGHRIAIALDAAEAQLKNDAAIPLALIVNELIVHAARRNGAGDKPLSIAVALTQADGLFRLAVVHDGAPFEVAGPQPRASGLGLVNGLAAQLHGTFRIESDKDVVAIVEFPATAGA